MREIQRKEGALLDNWEILREIEVGLLATAPMDDYVAAARRVGLFVDEVKLNLADPMPTVVLTDDRGRMVGVMIEYDHEVVVCPSPLPPSRLSP